MHGRAGAPREADSLKAPGGFGRYGHGGVAVFAPLRDALVR